ncbi:MAG: hypothetical protein M0Q91_13295 [Methanoregula sp.]|jgi:hypothetical protein|nr:hypothetical protein [Methanoregula sp.]
MSEDSTKFSQRFSPSSGLTASPHSNPNEQIVRHIHEGQEARPDSIEFSGTSKKAGMKVYFDASKPTEALERVEQAFVVYDYAVREMQKRNGEAA